MVTVHGNQECNALATVLWDNAFAEPVCSKHGVANVDYIENSMSQDRSQSFSATYTLFMYQNVVTHVDLQGAGLSRMVPTGARKPGTKI